MNMKISARLMAAFLLVGLLMAALSFYSVNIGRKSLKEAVGTSSMFLAEEMLKTINRDIYQKIEALRVHTSHSHFQQCLMDSNAAFEKLENPEKEIEARDKEWVSAKKNEITPFMNSLIHNELAESLNREMIRFYERRYGYKVFGEIFVTNRFGAVIAETGKTTDYRQNDELWWETAKERGFYVGDVSYDESVGAYAISVGVGIKDREGRFVGALKAVVDTKGIAREAKLVIQKYETTQVRVITTAGRLIYSTRAFSFLEDLSATPFFKQMKGESGFFMGESGKKEILYSWARSQGYRGFKGLGWILVVGHDADEVLAPAHSLRNRILIATCFLIALAVLIALFISRSITKPITRLTRGAGEIGRGNLDYRIQLPGNDALTQLAEAFNHMAAQRLTVEQSLRESEERFRGFFKFAAVGMAMGDPEGHFVQVNQAFCEIVGYDEPEMIGKPFQTMVHPEDLKEELPLVAQLMKGEISHYQREERLVHKEGFEVWVKVTVSLVRDKNGAPVNLIAGIENIAELKQHRDHLESLVAERTTELKRSNQELEQFAYVASHDLQEPLRKVQAFGDRFMARYGTQVDETGRDYLARMQSAAGRMGTMIQDLLSLSRVTTQGGSFSLLSLEKEVQRVLSDLEVRIDECKGMFVVDDLPTIEADPAQIRQLLLNLIGNAFKYRTPDVSPVVRIYARTIGTDENPLCELSVEDNGIGFEAQYLERIFQPFQRLHGRAQYEGTGIGLSICRKIAERHGGSITAKSTPGEGSTFMVTLPIRQPVKETEHG